jgi:hypothetical protein
MYTILHFWHSLILYKNMLYKHQQSREKAKNLVLGTQQTIHLLKKCVLFNLKKLHSFQMLE